MDIFAHTLWAAAAAETTNRKLGTQLEKQINVKWAAFWGVAPDLFAFTIPFVAMFLSIATGKASFSDFGNPATHPPPEYLAWSWKLAEKLYNISHSIVVFAVATFFVYLFIHRVPWEMFGWLLHILIDIPTHQEAFYPTPFLWPISNFHVSGISWAVSWFMALNYGSLVLVYFLLWFRR